MSKAKEISAMWSEIKPQLGKMINLCHQIESHAELHDNVTADAFQKGYDAAWEDIHPKIDAAYQKGLNDLWEAMQKAIKMYCEIDNEVFLRVFHDVKCDWGESVLQALFKNTPQHLIDSIRKYEQKQEEQIQVGDEVTPKETEYDDMIVTRLWKDDYDSDCIDAIGFDGRIGSFLVSRVSKTGKHYEIAAVLEKMRGEQDG